MVTTEQIQELVDRIRLRYQPKQVILFGSYAYGEPTADSDVDLLILLPEYERAISKAVEILREMEPHFAVDVVVRTPEQYRQRIAQGDHFLRDIANRGKILYDAAYAGMG
jgi:predicted nucleotidyltransferase